MKARRIYLQRKGKGFHIHHGTNTCLWWRHAMISDCRSQEAILSSIDEKEYMAWELRCRPFWEILKGMILKHSYVEHDGHVWLINNIGSTVRCYKNSMHDFELEHEQWSWIRDKWMILPLRWSRSSMVWLGKTSSQYLWSKIQPWLLECSTRYRMR